MKVVACAVIGILVCGPAFAGSGDSSGSSRAQKEHKDFVEAERNRFAQQRRAQEQSCAGSRNSGSFACATLPSNSGSKNGSAKGKSQ